MKRQKYTTLGKMPKTIFLSNCLIEALAAKFNDWDNIKIIYISPKINDRHLPHFMWYDKIDGNIYDFTSDFDIKCPLFWRGYIRVRTIKGFNNWYKKRTGREWFFEEKPPKPPRRS